MSICIAGPGLLRPDEAQAQQMQLYSRVLGATLITHHRPGDPIVEGSTAITLNVKEASRWPWSRLTQRMGIARFYRHHCQSFDRVILPGGIDKSLFSLIAPGKCIPLLSNQLTNIPSSVRRRFIKIAQRTPAILVTSKTAQDELLRLGIPDSKISLITPTIEDSHVRNHPPKKFTLLFASAPRGAPDEASLRFQEKGINLLFDAVSDLNIDVVLLWRQDYYRELISLLSSKERKCTVRVVNKNLEDASNYYSLSSAVVIPYAGLLQSPEYPRSAIEGLAAGIPVICTTVPEIHELISHEKCGVVSVPDASHLRAAILDVQKNRHVYSAHARRAFQKHFLLSPEKITQLKAAVQAGQ
ncbi:MAG TPA: glycosyltransferase family 4 protein [Candidatus Nanoarchaeia archaeon]|nr:glycosyltransferase family 4 protein [Candidatus Nanoarchaeia archaeon]